MDNPPATSDWNNAKDEFWNQDTEAANSSNNQINPSASHPQNQNIFFKTRICGNFMLGSCPSKEHTCNFAHGVHELRGPPPNWQENFSGERVAGDGCEQDRLNRNKLSRSFDYGDSSSVRETTVIEVETTTVRQTHSSDCIVLAGGGGGGGSGQTEHRAGLVEQSNKSEFWKTKMCYNWDGTGGCAFGENCNFAHGMEELREFGGGRAAVTENTEVVPAITKTDVAAAKGQEIMSRLQIQKHQSFDDPEKKKEQVFERLNSLKKINGIYGDWI